ncbi:ORF6N domain-containing protein [Levilactobacillus brevis]|uniref:ORF6N domain-containing protein n=1 Tax=Levilactobacillus brevis TaxID=1580 RepID=UPI0009C0E80D|nr:ORF6N domain-containing protein [Levilactobacillus brevis]
MNQLKVIGKENIGQYEFTGFEGGFGEGKRAMTVKDIAQVHGKDVRYINKLINSNRNRFKDDTDIIDLLSSSEELRNFAETNGLVGSNRTEHVYLLSERGYSKLLKILEDDKAWEIYDQLVDNYFNMRSQLDTTRLSPEIQFMQGVVDKLAANERNQCRLETKIDGVSEIVATSTMDWRNETSHLISKIARQQGNTGESYKMTRNDIYDEVDRRGGVSLKTRLTNLRRRMAEEGTSKTQRKNTTKVDVIAHDKKLIEIYTAIVKEFAIRYQVWNEEY